MFLNCFRTSYVQSCKLQSQSVEMLKSESSIRYQSIKTKVIYLELHCLERKGSKDIMSPFNHTRSICRNLGTGSMSYIPDKLTNRIQFVVSQLLGTNLKKEGKRKQLRQLASAYIAHGTVVLVIHDHCLPP